MNKIQKHQAAVRKSMYKDIKVTTKRKANNKSTYIKVILSRLDENTRRL
jgi:hypothetical protein